MPAGKTLGDDKNCNLLGLVELLQEIDVNQPNAKLNRCSMRNLYYKGQRGDDSELRTWFYHYKSLEKNGIIGSNEAVERQTRKPRHRI